MTIRTLKLAWKYRRQLWRYRKLYEHRKELAGVALASGVLITAALHTHGAK